MSLMVNGRSSAMRKGLDGIWTGTAMVGSGPVYIVKPGSGGLEVAVAFNDTATVATPAPKK
jgi:hypothetical protein